MMLGALKNCYIFFLSFIQQIQVTNENKLIQSLDNFYSIENEGSLKREEWQTKEREDCEEGIFSL